MRRLTTSGIKPHRIALLAEQGGKCLLCGEKIIDDAVLDHCHTSGRIRGVLHRGCNALLGKLENSLNINRMTATRLTSFLQQAQAYMSSGTDVLHPTYRTAEEKKDKAKRARRAALHKKKMRELRVRINKSEG